MKKGEKEGEIVSKFKFWKENRSLRSNLGKLFGVEKRGGGGFVIRRVLEYKKI